MATVSVNYQFRTFKVKISSNGNLNEVLEKSKTHFKLPDGNYKLVHEKKNVAHDLPWRLLNLPAGVNLTLVTVEDPVNPDSAVEASPLPSKTPLPIKIRFQTTNGYGSLVGHVGKTSIVYDTIKSISLKQGWDQDILDSSSQITVQIFSKLYKIDDLVGETFESLGINSSMAIRINLPSDITKESKESEAKQETEEDVVMESIVTPKETIPEHYHQELHKPTAYIPSDKPLAGQIFAAEGNENAYDLTVEHARRYQQILARKSGSLGGPLMTRRLREEREAKFRAKAVVKECLIRVKFPDLTYLEILFEANETMDSVYTEVSKSLVKEDLNFKLYQTHPHQFLECSNNKLVDDLNFASKTVLLFEVSNSNVHNGPFLKTAILSHASELTLPEHQEVNKTSKNETQPEIESNTFKKPLNKVPKWLKLSKK